MKCLTEPAQVVGDEAGTWNTPSSQSVVRSKWRSPSLSAHHETHLHSFPSFSPYPIVVTPANTLSCPITRVSCLYPFKVVLLLTRSFLSSLLDCDSFELRNDKIFYSFYPLLSRMLPWPSLVVSLCLRMHRWMNEYENEIFNNFSVYLLTWVLLVLSGGPGCKTLGV